MLTVVWSGRRPEDQKAPEGQLWLSCSRSFLGFPSWFLWGPSTLDLIQPLFLSWSENWAGLVDFRAGTKSTPQPAAQCGGDWTVSWPAQGHCWVLGASWSLLCCAREPYPLARHLWSPGWSSYLGLIPSVQKKCLVSSVPSLVKSMSKFCHLRTIHTVTSCLPVLRA